MTFTCATLIRDACRNDNPKVTAMRTAPSSFTRFPVLFYWLRRRSFVVWVNWKTACWKIQNYGLKATKLIDVTQSIAQSVFSLTVTYSSHRNFTRRQQVKCNEQFKTLAILLRSQDNHCDYWPQCMLCITDSRVPFWLWNSWFAKTQAQMWELFRQSKFLIRTFFHLFLFSFFF